MKSTDPYGNLPGGKKSVICVLAILMMMFLADPSSAMADKVSYTAWREGSAAGETTIFSVVSEGTTYTGTCARQGVAMSPSGTASVSKISNNSKVAKLVYHYAIELGGSNWWTSGHKTDKVGTILGMPTNDSTNVTKRAMIECFCQIYNMGASSWYSTITNPNSGGMATDTAARIRDFYQNEDVSNISVPGGFEIWYADAGNAQPFILWAYNPVGYVRVKKQSGGTSITG
ncbi:MAG: hypothetical protein E7227_07495 [Clostridiales bacterium]|nr:hypothetical protein [Clostridiales bacterium]